MLLALPGASQAAQVAANYRIHANDQLSIQVYGDNTLTSQVTVLPNGDIDYPLAGRIHVGFQTPDEAAKTIAKALKKYLRHPIVTVAVTQQGQLSVLVLGNVHTPGKHMLPPSSRLTDAIAAAGGLGATNGDLPIARLTDNDGTTEQVPLQKLFHDGDVSYDLAVSDGSMIYVPAPLTFTVEVVGAVSNPGAVQLSEGDRLSMAVAKAGATPSLQADLSRVHVTRTLADGRTLAFDVDLYRTLAAGDLRFDVGLQKGDVIYVPQNRKTLVNNGSAYYLLMGLRRLVGL
jgi:polysaccharide export outer membrane protein